MYHKQQQNNDSLINNTVKALLNSKKIMDNTAYSSTAETFPFEY